MILKKLVSLILLVNILVCSVFVTPVFAQDTPTLFFEFNEDSENITYAPHENEIVASDAQLYFNRSNNTNDCFVDITMGDYFKDVNEFVIDFVFVPVEIGTSLRLFRALNENTACNFIGLTKNSNLQICGSAYKDENGNYVNISKETRICLHVNIKDKLCDVYVGSQLIEDISFDGIYDPVGIKRFRLGTDSQNDATKFYANNIKIYSGSAPYDGDEFKRVRYTVMDKVDGVEKAKGILGRSVVFSKESFYADGRKQNCNILSAKPYFEGETLMVPSDATAYLGYDCKLLGDVITFNGVTIAVGNKTAVTQDNHTVVLDAAPVFKEGILFVPFKSFCELAELYTYCDNRGFTVASSGEINLSNSDEGSTITEDSDTVYRYLNFDRPSGKQIIDIIKSKDTGEPRLLATPKRIKKVKENIKFDSYAQELYKYTIAKANSILELDAVEYEKKDGVSIFSACNEAKNRLLALSAAYMLTDNSDYADKIWAEMKNALSWDDWNTHRHFLDTGEISPGIAVGYDVLRNGYLTPEQKTWIQQRLETLCLDFTMDAYVGYYTGSEFRYTSSNWGAVCSGGILSLCLALAADAENDFYDDLAYLIENSMHSMEYAAEVLIPEGTTGDGPVYWGFRTEYLTSYCIGALLNYCGDDYGFLSSKGWDNTFLFSLNLDGPGGAFSFGSCLERDVGVYLPQGYQAALIENDAYDMKAQYISRKLGNITINSLDCLWYEPELMDKYGDISLPTDWFYNGHEISVMRESWYSENSSYVGVIGGKNTIDSYFDKGSFVFDTNGVRWVADVGGENKRVTDYYGKAGHTLYRRRTEGQNCVVINPSSDTPGQVYDASAKIQKYDSSEKSAYCIYDLSDVYSDNVSKYKRGFYLGDDRQSLTIRDEISLLAKSDLYWFMHTRADIEISEDGHEAILKKDGKTLKATAICNIADWHFEVREAQPFDETMTREGEYSRDEFQKLTLVTSGSGNVNITVKLSPIEDDISPVTDTALSDWELESGTIEKKAEFLSSQLVKADSSGKANIKLRIPYKPQKMQVLLNGEEIFEQTEFGFAEEHYVSLNTKDIAFSNFVLKVICKYDEYVTESEKDFILLNNINTADNKFSCDFSKITNENILSDIKESGFTYVTVADGRSSMHEEDGALAVVLNDAKNTGAGYIEKTSLGIPSDGIIRFSFDMEADYGAAIYFSCQGIDYSPASSRIDIPSGTNGRVELILDGESYTLFVKDVNGNYIYSDDGVYSLSGLKKFRLTFYSMVAGAKIKLDNLSLEHFTYPESVVKEISRNNGNIILTMQRENENIYAASYEDNELLSAKCLAENESTLTLNENMFSKVFIWEEEMTPLMKLFKFQKGND